MMPGFSAITFDTLHVIYVAQFAIAVLTFFISLPVFYLLGYGNILFYSFLAAFCELIPVFGSTVAFIIIGAYALAMGRSPGQFSSFLSSGTSAWLPSLKFLSARCSWEGGPMSTLSSCSLVLWGEFSRWGLQGLSSAR